nr:hypothetical protein 3 [bacterium]
MTTQTQAADQVLTDQQLEALNGGGSGAMFGWIFANILTGFTPLAVDLATGLHVTEAARKAPF